MNFFNFHFLFNIYIIFAHASCKTVMLKFEELSDIGKIQSMDSLNNDKSIYLDLYDYLLYTTINIGEPSQLMLGIYNPETNVFEINSNDHCKNNNNYNYSYINSKSSKIITKEEGDYYTPGYLILNDSKQYFHHYLSYLFRYLYLLNIELYLNHHLLLLNKTDNSFRFYHNN